MSGGDWVDELDDAQRLEWRKFVEHTRRSTVTAIADSAFVMSLVPEGEIDVKFAVELGLSIMLDKPIIAVVGPGAKVPERLRRAVDRVVVADVDTEAGRETLRAAIEDLDRSEGRRA